MSKEMLVNLLLIPTSAQDVYIRYVDKYGASSEDDLMSWDIRNGVLLNDRDATKKYISLIESYINSNQRMDEGVVEDTIFPIPSGAKR